MLTDITMAKLTAAKAIADDPTHWYKGPWSPQPAGAAPWGHASFYGPQDRVLKGQRVRDWFAEGAAVISTGRFEPGPVRHEFEDLLLEDQGGASWGMRLYDVGAGSIFRRVSVVGMGCPGCGKEEGHAFYPNLAPGDTTIEWFRAERCGGQALQAVARSTEAAPGMYPGSGTLRVTNAAAIDCGQLPSRGSWPFSFVTSGHSYELTNILVATLGLQPWVDPIWGPSRSRGGILISDAGNPGEDPSVRTPSARLRDVHVVVHSSDRHLAKFKKIDYLDVQGCTFHDFDRGGSILIEDDVEAGRWVDVDGNYVIKHRGQTIQGPVDYEWS